VAVRDEDLEALRVGYRALNRDEAAFVLVHPEISWSPGEDSPDAGSFTGRDSFEAFVRSWRDAFDDFRLEPEEMMVAVAWAAYRNRPDARTAIRESR
jgi:hypothetical protein